MKNKLYPCKECGTKVKIRSKGLCPYCRSRQKGTLVSRYYLSQQTAKTKEKRRNRAQLLKVFFEKHLQTIQSHPNCENCGVRMACNIANIAHILPKRSTANPEVMDEPLNAMYLCASVNGEPGCHDRYDRIQGSAQVYLMPCWKKSVERYLTFREKVVKYNKFVKVFEDFIKSDDWIQSEDSIEPDGEQNDINKSV
jgi:hypothetical protein